jgi:hypothetical protein
VPYEEARLQRRIRQAADALEQALSICSQVQNSGEPSKNVGEIRSEILKVARTLERVASTPLFDEPVPEEEPRLTLKEKREARQRRAEFQRRFGARGGKVQG